MTASSPSPLLENTPPLLLPARFRPAVEWALLALALLLILVASVWQAGRWSRASAMAELRRSAETAVLLHVAALRNEVEKQRSLPFVLAHDPDVVAALRGRETAALNHKLEWLSRGSRAAVIYILDRNGSTIAASNWREPTSFVGQNYAFRHYFQAALTDGASEQFALGTVSRQPGYYLSRRVSDRDGIVGAVVVKLQFDGIEAEWRRGSEPSYVTDAEGVVLVTSHPALRFRTVGPLTAEVRQRVREEFQVGPADLQPLPFRPVGGDGNHVVVEMPSDHSVGEGAFLHTARPVPTTSWTLHTLVPLRPVVERSETQGRIIASLGTILAGCVCGVVLSARQRNHRRKRRQEAIRAELEERVEARTRDLRDANLRLEHEIEEHRRTEIARRQLGDELVQASKLATMGQISASVAHEVNQPLAAIRAYADNAAVLLDRDRLTDARANLSHIASLTERIGCITQHLKTYGRRASGTIEPVSVRAALDGSLMLVEHRIRRQSVAVTMDVPMRDVRAFAELVRFEQVIVNLIQNALDALTAVPQPRLTITLRAEEGRAILTITDNGGGINATDMAELFTPFFTTKSDGLGLGLAICRDIVHDFGGSITAAHAKGGGAAFSIELREVP